jgi:steroid 5-alpha reductase family enzyme
MGASLSTLTRVGKLAAVDGAIQGACFIVAAALQTEVFYDFSGSCTYIAMVLFGLKGALRRQGGKLSQRQTAAATMACVWAARLGSFLLQRIIQDGGDNRFNKVRNNPRIFAIYWAVQALWIFVTALPVWVMLSIDDRDEAERPSPPRTKTRQYAGWAMWVAGFATQVMADRQKSKFRADPMNKGKYITGGLWSWSQHPNYFGEITMWAGVWLSTSGAFRGIEHVAAISPMFVYYLLTRVSGVPLLRKASLKKWGHLPEYLAHMRRVPVLLPIPPFLH